MGIERPASQAALDLLYEKGICVVYLVGNACCHGDQWVEAFEARYADDARATFVVVESSMPSILLVSGGKVVNTIDSNDYKRIESFLTGQVVPTFWEVISNCAKSLYTACVQCTAGCIPFSRYENDIRTFLTRLPG